MAQEKTRYRGNCHCASFIFEVTIPEITEVNVCGCSICYKKNYALVFVEKTDFTMVKGRIEDFTTYTFGPGNLKHMFCPTCAMTVVCMHDKLPGQIAARAIQGPLDVWNMPKKIFPGKGFEPQYVPPDYSDLPGPEVELQGEGRVYHGSCHCGDVRLALKVPPLETFEGIIGECNCSLCQRAGTTWIYSSRPQLSWSPDWTSDKYGRYDQAGARLGNQIFCRRCGIYVANKLKAETEEEFSQLPEKLREFLADKRDLLPVNLRLFDAVDLDGGQIKVQRVDGYNLIQPPYENP